MKKALVHLPHPALIRALLRTDLVPALHVDRVANYQAFVGDISRQVADDLARQIGSSLPILQINRLHAFRFALLVFCIGMVVDSGIPPTAVLSRWTPGWTGLVTI